MRQPDILPPTSHPVPAGPQRVESRAIHRNLAASASKMNEVCALVRGMSVEEALTQLSFSQTRKAVHVKNCIRNARTAAVNNFGLDSERLYVAEAWVGRAKHVKRPDYKAKGRFGMKSKYKCHLQVVVREWPSDGSKPIGVSRHVAARATLGVAHAARIEAHAQADSVAPTQLPAGSPAPKVVVEPGSDARIGKAGPRPSSLRLTLARLAAIKDGSAAADTSDRAANRRTHTLLADIAAKQK
jgi:large subunit ribosomal protein L22